MVNLADFVSKRLQRVAFAFWRLMAVAVGGGGERLDAGSARSGAHPHSSVRKLARQDIGEVIARRFAQGDEFLPGVIPSHACPRDQVTMDRVPDRQ